MQLLQNPVFLLCLIIITGSFIGRIPIGPFSFGSSAIILVALAFGHLNLILPKVFQTLGLLLFIYSIGLQAGPAFFKSFRRKIAGPSLAAFLLVTIGFLCTYIVAYIFKYPPGVAAGIFSGALTSSPGLAVAVALSDEKLAVTAYGVTYTFGILGVIFFIRLIPQIMKIDIKNEEKKLRDDAEKQTPKIIFRHFEVNNPNLVNKHFKDIRLNRWAPVTVTRIQHIQTGTVELLHSDTVLQKGDVLRVIGTEDDLELVGMYIGEPVASDIKFDGEFILKKIMISKKEMAGRSIESFNFREVFNVQISRITRNDIDIPAVPETRLQIGDVLHVVGQNDAVDNMMRLLGNDVKAAYIADILSIFFGIFIGLVLGRIPLSLPFTGTFTLGYSGGVLLAGLILGNIYKTGPIVWSIPEPANTLIREFGLMVFLATAGTSAGSTIYETIKSQGLILFISGIFVTLLPLISMFFINHYILKFKFLRNLGILTGGMTSTPGLATVQSLSKTPYAPSAYASVYPFALISMILFTKLLIGLLGFF